MILSAKVDTVFKKPRLFLQNGPSMEPSRAWAGISEPGRVPGHEPGGVGAGEVPARAGALLVADRVPAQARDLGEGVAGVGVDGDPLAGARRPPVLQLAGGEGAGDEAAAEEGEADRARAVVGVVIEGGVAAAPDVWAADDLVAALIAPLTASGASGGGRATPVRRIALDPPRLWAKISARLRCERWGTVVPLLPAEAGGSFEGSAAISAAVGTAGAAGFGDGCGAVASTWWRTLTSARLSLTASIARWPPPTPRPAWPKAIRTVASAAVAPIAVARLRSR